MANALALRIGGDVTGLDRAMKRASDIVAYQGKQMITTTLAVGKAMDSNLALRGLKYAAQNSTSLTAALRGLAVGLGAIAVGYGIFKTLEAATAAAAEQVERLAKIGDAAAGVGVSTSFFQAWTGQARNLKVEVEDLEKSLEQLKKVATVSQGEGQEGKTRNQSPLEARLRQQVEAGNLSSGDLNKYLGASDTEQRLYVLLDLMQQLQRQGKDLAALDLARQFFPPKIVEGIRNGTIEIDRLKQRLADVKNSDLQIFEDADIQNAREMLRRLDEAKRILSNELKPIYEDFAHAGRNFYTSTVEWTEALAGGVRMLAQAYKYLKDAGGEADRIAKNVGNSGFAVALNDRLKQAFPDSYNENNTTPIAQQLRKADAGRAAASSLAARLGGGAQAEAALAELAGRMNPTNVAAAQAKSRDMTAGFLADKTKPIITSPKASNPSADTDRTTSMERYIAQLERARDVARAEAETVGLTGAAREKAVALARAQAAAQADVREGLRDSAALTDAEKAKIEAAAAATAKWKEEAENLRDSLEFAKGLAGDALKGFVSDLKEGKSAADALKNALDRISTKILDKLIDATVSGLFGGSGSGGNIFAGFGKLLGFDDGGWTGAGGKYEPAGIVHKGEYIFDQASVKAAGGPQALEAMRQRLRGYAEGGFVGAMSMPSVPSGIGAASSGPTKIVIQNTQSENVQADAKQDRNGDITVLISAVEARMADNMLRGRGPMSAAQQAIQTNKRFR